MDWNVNTINQRKKVQGRREEERVIQGLREAEEERGWNKERGAGRMGENWKGKLAIKRKIQKETEWNEKRPVENKEKGVCGF